MSHPRTFTAHRPLLETLPHRACQASIILPARNEEASLPEALNALAAQTDQRNRALDPTTFEVLLLLNNCTDASAAVAHRWSEQHPSVVLHILERTLPHETAHVGTARRLLMDTAWHRLHRSPHPVTGILSTDSDTLADTHWLANTLAAFTAGADAVGGVIRLKPGEFESLPPGAQLAYRHDRRFQRLVAELEDLLDPQPGDPWPRHLEHFGASLACTPAAYARAGGMPPVKPLEDIAFVDALRRSNARLRHDPSVVVYTSARLDGRAEIGLSHQLRLWQRMSEEDAPHEVPTAAALTHRFRTLRNLRDFFHQATPQSLATYSEPWRQRIVQARRHAPTPADLLSAIDCDRLVHETFTGTAHAEITRVNRNLARTIRRLKSEPPTLSDNT